MRPAFLDAAHDRLHAVGRPLEILKELLPTDEQCAGNACNAINEAEWEMMLRIFSSERSGDMWLE